MLEKRFIQVAERKKALGNGWRCNDVTIKLSKHIPVATIDGLIGDQKCTK